MIVPITPVILITIKRTLGYVAGVIWAVDTKGRWLMEEHIKKVIAEEIDNLHPDGITNDSRILVELGASYAEFSNIIVRLEQDYDIDIFSDIKTDDLLTVGELIEIVKKKEAE